MKLYKTYKYKLKLSTPQEKIINSWMHTCRYIYNVALEERITAYGMAKKSISKFDQYKELTDVKKDFKFVREVYSDVLQETLDRVDKAYKNFFRGAGFPKFAKKDSYNSFTYKRFVSVTGGSIKLPKIGLVKYFNSRPIIGKIKTATIIKEGKNYFICIVSEYDSKEELKTEYHVSIDVGIAHFATLSTGETIDTPLFLETKLNKLRLLQRKLARQKRGSNSRQKTIQKIQKLYLKTRNQRTDFLHKQSTEIANRFTHCYIEDLKVSKMKAINSALTRKMRDSGFYMFRQFLEYKFKERGNTLIAVNPAYTSQTCSACLSVDKKSRISQAEFVCISCSFIENADLNACKNIMRQGMSQIAERKTIV